MSDDLVKKLLESLTPEQRNELVQGLLDSNVKSDEVPPQDMEVTQKSSVKEDFSVTRSKDFLEKRKSPVRGKRNEWVDDGEDRDPDFDPVKFEKMGRASRNRGKANKRTLECHVCGKTFSINANLVHGEYIRCNKCTGR